MLALKAHDACPVGVTVGDVMVKDPVVAIPSMEANDLRRLMIEKHSRYLPVLENDTLLGVISFLDVAKAVLEEQNLENKLLKSYIKNWPDEKAD
jgi:CBS domain-containing protein